MTSQYNILSKLFHWTIAALILGLLVVGFYMEGLERSPFKFEIYGWHKSFGLLVLWLAGLRIIWCSFTQKPKPLETHKPWEKALSKAMHIFLYVAMVGMPLSGWFMSASGGHSVSFFGLEMPNIMAENKAINSLSKQTHNWLGYILILAIMLHVIGALKHHVIDNDMTLRRMSPKMFFKLWQFLVLVGIILFTLGVLKFGFWDRIQNILPPLDKNPIEEQSKDIEPQER